MRERFKLKKLKNSGLYIFLFFALIFSMFSHSGIANEKENLISAYQKSGAEIINVHIHSNVLISNRRIDLEEAFKISGKLAKSLEVQECTIVNSKADDSKEKSQVSWIGKDSDENNVSLDIHFSPSNPLSKTYISVDATMKDKWSNLELLKKKIKKALSPYGTASLNICITGNYEGRISHKEKTEAIKKIIRGLGGEEEENFEEGPMLSVTAFSGRLGDWIAYDGKKVNMQISLRYNSFEEKTYLWLGTPLIDIAY
jgi:CheY-specific phosphatase CheX